MLQDSQLGLSARCVADVFQVWSADVQLRSNRFGYDVEGADKKLRRLRTSLVFRLRVLLAFQGQVLTVCV